MNVGIPGIRPRSMAMMTLISPELPAAGSECPMLLLIYVHERASVRRYTQQTRREGVGDELHGFPLKYIWTGVDLRNQ